MDWLGWLGSFFGKRSVRVLKSEREGVRPPEGREVHSSILEAPFWAARSAEWGLKDAISRLNIFANMSDNMVLVQ